MNNNNNNNNNDDDNNNSKDFEWWLLDKPTYNLTKIIISWIRTFLSFL